MASSVQWKLLEDEPAQVGDLVSLDAGGMPIFRVVSLDAGRAWLQDDMRHPPQARSLEDFRWKGVDA
jgi:hypothetical protein